MSISDINIQKIILMARRKIIEIKENGEINGLIDRRKKGIRKRSILIEDKRKGYLKVQLHIDGEYIQAFAHRVIWYYFNGKIKEGYQINHIDGDKKNNNINNLEVVTAKENTEHAINVIKTKTGWKREKNIKAKITMNDARQIRKLRREKFKVKEIEKAIEYKVSRKQIYAIINKKYWKEENELVQA